jgi:hypothetical protein
MPRSIRFIPEGGALVEVTDRTVQARLLLVPSQELNEVVIGVLGRAQRLYKVRICGFVARLRRALDNDEIPSRRDRGKQLR